MRPTVSDTATESSPSQLPSHATARPVVAVIGAGPAGLMAAEVLAQGGAAVEVYDAMASAGRKFLLAGKGGLNLTHSEPLAEFVGRYREAAPVVQAWLEKFSPDDLRAWAHALGVNTFVGTSGRVFPEEMKAAPLLRAWLARLRRQGVRFHMRHRWVPCERPMGEPGPQTLCFETPAGRVEHTADAVVLALGGGSWSRLGSDGRWVAPLQAWGVSVSALVAANCGFETRWSTHLVERFAGTPLKNVTLRLATADGVAFERLGECVVTASGLEGSLVYAASALLRRVIEREGTATPTLDLLPHRTEAALTEALAKGRGARSFSNHLREQTGLTGARAALLREGLDAGEWNDITHHPARMAQRIKALPITLHATRPLDEAISSAGGVRLGELDSGLCLNRWPRLALAGEMLDWEAPTGGYLLTASMASGRVAGQGLLAKLGLAEK